MGPKANKNTNKRYLEIIWYLKYCCRNCGFIFCVSNYCEIRIAMSYTMKICSFDVECQVERFYWECRWCKMQGSKRVLSTRAAAGPGPRWPRPARCWRGSSGRWGPRCCGSPPGWSPRRGWPEHASQILQILTMEYFIHILGTLCDHDHIYTSVLL